MNFNVCLYNVSIMFWYSQIITKACIVFMCFVVGHKHCVKARRHSIVVQFKHEYCGLHYIDLIQFQYLIIQEELTGMCKIICIRQNSNCSFLQSYYAIQFKCICITPYHVTIIDRDIIEKVFLPMSISI